MSNCPRCGNQTGEKTSFVPRCDIQLRQPTLKDHSNVSSAAIPKPVITLANGILIGVGIVGLIISLLGAFSLNASYINISSFLENNGVPPIGIRFTLRDIVSLLSVCFFGVVMSSNILAGGLLNQFSKRAQFAWKLNDETSRIASGLMSGGAVLASLSGANVVRELYEPSFGWFGSISVITTIVGSLLMAVGFLLLLARKPETDVKAQ